jgi:hypothetical protein
LSQIGTREKTPTLPAPEKAAARLPLSSLEAADALYQAAVTQTTTARAVKESGELTQAETLYKAALIAAETAQKGGVYGPEGRALEGYDTIYLMAMESPSEDPAIASTAVNALAGSQNAEKLISEIRKELERIAQIIEIIGKKEDLGKHRAAGEKGALRGWFRKYKRLIPSLTMAQVAELYELRNQLGEVVSGKKGGDPFSKPSFDSIMQLFLLRGADLEATERTLNMVFFEAPAGHFTEGFSEDPMRLGNFPARRFTVLRRGMFKFVRDALKANPWLDDSTLMEILGRYTHSDDSWGDDETGNPDAPTPDNIWLQQIVARTHPESAHYGDPQSPYRLAITSNQKKDGELIASGSKQIAAHFNQEAVEELPVEVLPGAFVTFRIPKTQLEEIVAAGWTKEAIAKLLTEGLRARMEQPDSDFNEADLLQVTKERGPLGWLTVDTMDVLWGVDLEGNIAFMNRALLELKSEAQRTGDPILHAIADAQLKSGLSHEVVHFLTRRGQDLELALREGDAFIVGTALRDQRISPQRYSAVMNDGRILADRSVDFFLLARQLAILKLRHQRWQELLGKRLNEAGAKIAEVNEKLEGVRQELKNLNDNAESQMQEARTALATAQSTLETQRHIAEQGSQERIQALEKNVATIQASQAARRASAATRKTSLNEALKTAPEGTRQSLERLIAEIDRQEAVMDKVVATAQALIVQAKALAESGSNLVTDFTAKVKEAENALTRIEQEQSTLRSPLEGQLRDAEEALASATRKKDGNFNAIASVGRSVESKNHQLHKVFNEISGSPATLGETEKLDETVMPVPSALEATKIRSLFPDKDLANEEVQVLHILIGLGANVPIDPISQKLREEVLGSNGPRADRVWQNALLLRKAGVSDFKTVSSRALGYLPQRFAQAVALLQEFYPETALPVTRLRDILDQNIDRLHQHLATLKEQGLLDSTPRARDFVLPKSPVVSEIVEPGMPDTTAQSNIFEQLLTGRIGDALLNLFVGLRLGVVRLFNAFGLMDLPALDPHEVARLENLAHHMGFQNFEVRPAAPWLFVDASIDTSVSGKVVFTVNPYLPALTRLIRLRHEANHLRFRRRLGGALPARNPGLQKIPLVGSLVKAYYEELWVTKTTEQEMTHDAQALANLPHEAILAEAVRPQDHSLRDAMTHLMARLLVQNRLTAQELKDINFKRQAILGAA